VARPSERDLEYIEGAQGRSWKDLNGLWNQIKAGHTPNWDDGKALEHLVIRAFRLSRLEAEYPYDVPTLGKPIEQIDGLVYMSGNTFLTECKDKETVDITAIAKLRNQLLRRPDTTFGCVFAADRFSPQALILVGYSVPHKILLWSGEDIEAAFHKKSFKATLLEKYRYLCKYGLSDHTSNYKGLEV